MEWLKRELSRWVGRGFGESAIDSLKSLIEAEYARQGFLWVQVRPELNPGPDGVAIRFEVFEGSRAGLGRVRILGGPGMEIELPRGQHFTQELLEAQMVKVLEVCADLGFPFASVEPANFEVVQEAVNYDLVVTQGPLVELDRVELTAGPRALSRVMGIEPGEVYSQRRIDSGLERLRTIKGLRVEGYELLPRNGNWVLRVKLAPESKNLVWGAVGLDPQAREYWGEARLDLKHLLGSLRRVSLHYQGGRGRITLGIRYEEPYPFGWNLRPRVELSHSSRGTAYSRIFLLGGVGFPLANWELRFELGWEAVVSESYWERSWVGSGVGQEGRDYPENPRRGWFLDLGSRVGVSRGSRLWRSTLDGGWVIKITEELCGSAELHLRNLTGPDLPDPYQGFSLGGASSLRGYHEDAILSNSLGWLNLELRRLSGREGRWFSFLDLAGYDTDGYSLAQSLGLGVRAPIEPGALELAYGVALGTPILEGLLHISFGWEF